MGMPYRSDPETERVFETVTAKRTLPILDDIRVASPCNASWDAMDGDDRVRFCGDCKKNVYNLSAMTRDEAEALITEREGKICARFYRRKDGTVLTTDCSVGARRKRNQRIAIGIGAGLLAGAVGTTASLFTAHTGEIEVVGKMSIEPPIMGSIAAPPAELTLEETKKPKK